MEALLVGVVFGFGILLVFDSLTRPDAKPDISRLIGRLGPQGAMAIAGGVLALVATGWPVAVLAGAFLGAALPRFLASSRKDQQRLRRMEAIAEVGARLRDSIRAGMGIQDALSHAAANSPDAISSDLRQLVAEARVSGLATAASTFAGRLGPDAETLGAALSLGERLGARNTSDVLETLAEATAARAATLREARARQTRARMSARVVAAAPVVLLVAIRFTNPAYLAPFDTPGGQMMLAFALALIASGYSAMIRTARVDGSGA